MAERIVQSRFSLPHPPPSIQPRSHSPPPPQRQLPPNQHRASFAAMNSMQKSQSLHGANAKRASLPLGAVHTTHFSIGHTLNTQVLLSEDFAQLSTKPNGKKKNKSLPPSPPIKPVKPPIDVKQSYTPPVQPHSNGHAHAYGYRMREQPHSQPKPPNGNSLQPFSPPALNGVHSAPQSPSHSAQHTQPRRPHKHKKRLSHSMSPRAHQKSSSYDFRPLPSLQIQPNNPPQANVPSGPARQQSAPDELPLGWAKLVDEDGFYYFNVITATKQRERPQHDAHQINVNANANCNANDLVNAALPPPPSARPLPSPYAHDVAPSVMTDSLSVAELEYRKKNGSTVFAAVTAQNGQSGQNQLRQQQNWDLLVDAVYLNLSARDYDTVFKALRSIAENLFDEDDKYRILYADNRKVQQRILSRIGGYEFLRGLGFREQAKRKLVCAAPDFDVVATAITAINAKLAMLERDKPHELLILPDDVQIEKAVCAQYQQQYQQQLEHVMEDEVSYDDEEDEKTAVLSKVQSKQHTMSSLAEGNARKNVNNNVSGGVLVSSRQRNGTVVTLACYSDEDDGKQAQPAQPAQPNGAMPMAKVTDAGVAATTAYMSSLARAQSAQRAQHSQPQMERIAQKRKRSLSIDDEKQHKPSRVYGQYGQYAQRQRQRPSQSRIRRRGHGQQHAAARQKSHTQHEVGANRQAQSSSPRSLDDMDAMAIESEIARAYQDTKRVLTMRDLELQEEEEDVESLFEQRTQRRRDRPPPQHSQNRAQINARSPMSHSPEVAAWQSSQVAAPMGILLPSEQKRQSRKRKKTAQKIRKSVKGFLSALGGKGNKNNRKYIAEREEYRAQHPEDEEHYYAFYGEPEREREREEVHTVSVTVEFEDATVVQLQLEPESAVSGMGASRSSRELIELALEKRGWSRTMAHLFDLSVDGAPIEKHVSPMAALAHSKAPSASFTIKYKPDTSAH